MTAVKNYVESGRALQAKYEELRTGVLERKNIFEEHFDPIIRPLKEISTTLKTSKNNIDDKGLTDKQRENFIKLIGPLAYDYLFCKSPSHRDTTFGLYHKNGILYLGNLPISVEDNNITMDNEIFKGTKGLWELLTLKDPKYNNDDLNVYEHLIMKSSSHRKQNDPNNSGIKASSGTKYKKIIQPMLTRQRNHQSLSEEMNASSSGSGLRKILTNTPVEYVYWNTLDELLDRLYIAWGEIKAGNTSNILRNEVVNILQEIKEI
jgi:hypothetical protein